MWDALLHMGGPVMHNPLFSFFLMPNKTPPQTAQIKRNQLTALLQHPFRLLFLIDYGSWHHITETGFLKKPCQWICFEYSLPARCCGGRLHWGELSVSPSHTEPQLPALWRWKEPIEITTSQSTQAGWRFEGLKGTLGTWWSYFTGNVLH